MKDSRLLFTFGTIYAPTIITALLGYEPKNFSAVLKDYAVFQGNKNGLSEEMKNDLGQKHNLDTFVFLFAKKVESSRKSQISGKAYFITDHDEYILDHWERFPQWYQKAEVVIEDSHGQKFAAFIYTQHSEGTAVSDFKRNPYNLERLVVQAQKLRASLKE